MPDHGIPPTDQTEPAFTTVLLAMIADCVARNEVRDANTGELKTPPGPHITRMEDNRFLWQTGKLTMSVTINDVTREYM